VECPRVGELEGDGRVASLRFGKRAVVNEQGTGEPRLDHDVVSRREVENDQLRAPPGSEDRRASYGAGQGSRSDLAEHIRVRDGDLLDDCTPDHGVEITRDGFGFR